MSLKDKKSLFDRTQLGNLGSEVGTNVEYNFFTDRGLNMTSPFDAKPDLPNRPGGQMVQLLNQAVTSNNHPYSPHNGSLTYNPSTKDLNGAAGQPSDFFDEGILSGRKGQYKNNGPTDGRY